MPHILLVIVFGLLLLPGFLMALVPMLPAFWYLLAVAVLFGVIDGFVHLTVPNLGVLFGMFALSVIVDWSAGLLGAKFGGAAWRSLLYGAAGGVVGMVIFPPFGIFSGLFVGILIGELIRRRNDLSAQAGTEAVRAAAGALLGSLSGIVINTALAVAFIAFFIVFAAA